MKMPKILFFIAGTAPDEKEREAALDIGGVAMRNVSLIGPNDNPESGVDAVAGAVIPEPYKDFPVVSSLADAIKIVREKQKAENAAASAALAADANGDEGGATPGATGGKETPKRAGLGGTGNQAPAPAAKGWKANA